MTTPDIIDKSKRPKPQKQGSLDDFQTPPEALCPLLKYVPKHWTIWEPAQGKGFLLDELQKRGFTAHGSDIKTGHDFLLSDSPVPYDCVITNPPFSIKNQFLKTCYDRQKPFALLMPITTFESLERQKLFKTHGVEVIFLNRRINFETPSEKGVKSCSWFATAWFTHGLQIGNQITFEDLPNKKTVKTQPALL
jgi:hypothetical protein